MITSIMLAASLYVWYDEYGTKHISTHHSRCIVNGVVQLQKSGCEAVHGDVSHREIIQKMRQEQTLKDEEQRLKAERIQLETETRAAEAEAEAEQGELEEERRVRLETERMYLERMDYITAPRGERRYNY